MLPLILGTLLAVGALTYVLFPLFAGPSYATRRAVPAARAGADPAEGEAVVALREIEFDRATGKLSDGDYAELKARYTERALAALREQDSGAGEIVDAAEAAVLAYRARMRRCPSCGPRPEPDATYCSNCGTYLPGSCAGCGSVVIQPGSTFCNACGRRLAA